MCDNMDNTSIDDINQRICDLSLSTNSGDMSGVGTSGLSSGCASAQDVEYMTDSMDRFGDDLVELILSYLPFNDKVSLESVSKQWRRVIYIKQTKLDLNRSETEEQNTLNKMLKDIEVTDYSTGFAHSSGFKAIHIPSLESVLKKCSFLSQICLQCYIDGQVLDVIGRHCHYLKCLECNPIGLKEQTLSQFGQKYGQRLELIRFNDSNYCSVFIKKFLKFCLNLKEVYSEDNSAFISDDPMFLPKLETIKSIDIRTEQLDQLKILSDKYWQTMKTIKIHTYHMVGHQLKNALTYISLLENLQSLSLSISIFDEDLQPIDENMAEIVKNCSKLKKLTFNLNNETVITNRFLFAFNKLHSIEKINLEFNGLSKKLDGTVDIFRRCPKLKHLVISYNELSEDFFINISSVLPNLKIIDIKSDKQMSDNFMNSLTHLNHLKKIILKHSANAHKDMTDDSICQVLTTCPNISTIMFSARPNITHKTIETLIEIASKRRKTNINFICGLSVAGDEGQFTPIDLDSYAQRIPENLKISIDLGQPLEQNPPNN